MNLILPISIIIFLEITSIAGIIIFYNKVLYNENNIGFGWKYGALLLCTAFAMCFPVFILKEKNLQFVQILSMLYNTLISFLTSYIFILFIFVLVMFFTIFFLVKYNRGGTMQKSTFKILDSIYYSEEDSYYKKRKDKRHMQLSKQEVIDRKFIEFKNSKRTQVLIEDLDHLDYSNLKKFKLTEKGYDAHDNYNDNLVKNFWSFSSIIVAIVTGIIVGGFF